MKVAIFGASGGTGSLLTERCLAAGYAVTALRADSGAVPIQGPSASRAGQRVRRGGGASRRSGRGGQRIWCCRLWARAR